MELVFATNNQNKVNEIQALLPKSIKLLSLLDINCTIELPETQPTLQGNALQKARFVYDNYKINCFADDTGLEIDALNGRPGVYSARYAGEKKLAEDNIAKVLLEMSHVENRSAKFRTVTALVLNGNELLFEGEVEGLILYKAQGEKGFGYDPVFAPTNGLINASKEIRSFAEMTIEEKNRISHRGKAVKKLVDYLVTL